MQSLFSKNGQYGAIFDFKTQILSEKFNWNMS